MQTQTNGPGPTLLQSAAKRPLKAPGRKSTPPKQTPRKPAPVEIQSEASLASQIEHARQTYATALSTLAAAKSKRDRILRGFGSLAPDNVLKLQELGAEIELLVKLANSSEGRFRLLETRPAQLERKARDQEAAKHSLDSRKRLERHLARVNAAAAE